MKGIFRRHCSTLKQRMQQSSAPADRRRGAGGLDYEDLQIDLDDFALLSDDPPVRAITARQYQALDEGYRACPLDHAVLFPWLHGCDGLNVPQKLFFGVTRCDVPCYRGLALVRAKEEQAPPAFDGGLPWQPPLSGPPRLSAQPAKSQVLRPWLVGSLDEEDVISGDERCRFNVHQSQKEPGPFPINLRSFDLQPSRFATISDLVVYSASPRDIQPAINAAKRLSQAQVAFRGGCFSTKPKLFYNTFVLTDDFLTIERTIRSLVAVNSEGKRVGHFDFFEREREELLHMTTATEIIPNVWLGNSQESAFDVLMSHVPDPEDSRLRSSVVVGHQALTTENEESGILVVPNVAADAVPGLPAYSGASFSRQDSGFAMCGALSPERSPKCRRKWDLHVDCSVAAVLPTNDDFERINQLLSKGRAVSVVCPSAIESCRHLDFFGDESEWNWSQVTRMMAYVQFISDEAEAHGRRVIIHCPDGYTETSFLALCVLMHRIVRDRLSQGCTSLTGLLPEAYLRLQAARSFFIFSNDTEGLEGFERLAIRLFTPRPSTLPISPSPTNPSPGQMESPCLLSNSPRPPDSGTTALPSSEPSADTDSWFASRHFDGSMPSRILPHLYLGSIRHAFNPGLLRALGITSVVSVGEKSYLPLRGPSNEAGFDVLEIASVMDDGRDGLLERLDDCAEFIENSRSNNGKTLVHCHVGVSRSATVVIAYCLRHPEHVAAAKRRHFGLGYGPVGPSTLTSFARGELVGPITWEPEALASPDFAGATTDKDDSTATFAATLSEVYLYVRARRLKVIIQVRAGNAIAEDPSTQFSRFVLVKNIRSAAFLPCGDFRFTDGVRLFCKHAFSHLRRLQPNLLLFCELLEYERRIRGRAHLSWAPLAKEIGRLNAQYAP